MDPQLSNLLVALGIGLIAIVLLRTVFRVINFGLNLLLLLAIVVIAFIFLSGGR